MAFKFFRLPVCLCPFASKGERGHRDQNDVSFMSSLIILGKYPVGYLSPPFCDRRE